MSYIEIQAPIYDKEGNYVEGVVFRFTVFEYKNCECGKSFQSEELLNEHLDCKENDVCAKKLMTEYQCMLCSKTLMSHFACTIHISQMHCNTKKKRKKHEPKSNLVCDICSKKFNTSCQFRIHHRSHTGEKPFFCPSCPKRFTAAAYLKLHMNVHSGEKPYKCKTCDRAFSSPSNLQRHNLVHTGERPYSCDICGKSYQQQVGLKEHFQIKHLNIPPKPRQKKNINLKYESDSL